MVEAIIEDLGIPAVLRGYLTQSDGAAVLSTTLPRHTSCGQAREQRCFLMEANLEVCLKNFYELQNRQKNATIRG
jgi:hypothetical protein